MFDLIDGGPVNCDETVLSADGIDGAGGRAGRTYGLDGHFTIGPNTSFRRLES